MATCNCMNPRGSADCLENGCLSQRQYLDIKTNIDRTTPIPMNVTINGQRPEPDYVRTLAHDYDVMRESYVTVVELLAEFIDGLDEDSREYYLKCQLGARLQELAVNDVLNTLDQIEEARRINSRVVIEQMKERRKRL